jgi:hypothetical protein
VHDLVLGRVGDGVGGRSQKKEIGGARVRHGDSGSCG